MFSTMFNGIFKAQKCTKCYWHSIALQMNERGPQTVNRSTALMLLFNETDCVLKYSVKLQTISNYCNAA